MIMMMEVIQWLVFAVSSIEIIMRNKKKTVNFILLWCNFNILTTIFQAFLYKIILKAINIYQFCTPLEYKKTKIFLLFILQLLQTLDDVNFIADIRSNIGILESFTK